MMHAFLYNFHQGGKYSTQIAIHRADLRIENKFTDQKSLNISSLQTDYLNLDSSSVFGRNSYRAHSFHTKCTFFGVTNHSAEKYLKGSDRKSKKLVWLVLRTIDKRNGHLENVLDVDLKIT